MKRAVVLAWCACACASAPKRLEYGVHDSAAVGQEMGYAVYTPPGWTPAETLPLVVFLHGGGDSEDCFDRAGVGQHLDAAILAGTAPRVVIAVPDGGLGFWENWYDGTRRFRDWVTLELMPLIEAKYRTAPCPAGCHVAGISMGGHGAVQLAMAEPSRFATATTISGLILDSAAAKELASGFFIRLFIPVARIWGPFDDPAQAAKRDPFQAWQTQADLQGVRLMVAWGATDREPILRSNEKLVAHLTGHHIAHERLVFPGGHAWTAWTPMLPDVLRAQVGARVDAPPRDGLEDRPVTVDERGVERP